MKDIEKYKVEDCFWLANYQYLIRYWTPITHTLYDLDSFIFIAYKDNFNLKDFQTLRRIEMCR